MAGRHATADNPSRILPVADGNQAVQCAGLPSLKGQLHSAFPLPCAPAGWAHTGLSCGCVLLGTQRIAESCRQMDEEE